MRDHLQFAEDKLQQHYFAHENVNVVKKL